MPRRPSAAGSSRVPAYRPQLARLVKAPPRDGEWIHEMKYDGYRIGCRVASGAVTLLSRTGKDWTAAFPEIVDAVRALGARQALLDGEVAIVLPDGRTSFQALQNVFSGGARRGLVYFAFDLLHVEGRTLTSRPLLERKEELLRLLGRPGSRTRIRYSEHVAGRGDEMFEEACRLGLEGIIAKRADAPYKAGRNDSWLKVKCTRRQEFVIGGFTDPEGSRQGIGALLVGYYTPDGQLAFAGKVGTGFTAASARDLRARLERIERDACPFEPPPAGWLGRHAHWVAPRLVGEVAFSEWTEDGKIRHPSFQGLRRDKAPADVVRETAVPVEAVEEKPARPPRAAGRVDVAGVSISHPGRVMLAEPGTTKLDLARYYERIAERMLPHVEGRPLTLVRCPDGVPGSCFYMKHSKVWAPQALRRVRIQEKTKVGDYLIADSAAALVALAQMDVLEIHTWNSRFAHVEHPDRIVLDLDPGAQVTWAEVADAARLVRRLLASLDLACFPKTTGGRGLHVVVPLRPTADWQACLAFSRAVAEAVVRHDPDRFTTAFAKAGRERKILIDYLRNNRTNTSVAAFSTRAKPSGTVSMPLRWSDVTARLDPGSFTIATVDTRLARLTADPWKDYWSSRQRLTASMTKAMDGDK